METMISIISICSTVLLGIVGFIINTCLQRKANSIDIITRKRLARRDKLQELSAKILSISDLDFLENTKAEDLSGKFVELTEACSAFRSLLEFGFECDAMIVNLSYHIKKEVVNYFDNSDHKNLVNYRRDFSHLTDLYFTTEWRRIKCETVGKSGKGSNGYNFWKELYEENSEHFEKNKTVHDDIYVE